VPYAGPRGQPPQLALPPIYRRLATPVGIVGAVVVEASPWVEDNLWILERAASDPLFVGVIGNLAPNHPDFAELLHRFAKHPLWRGIRHSAVWSVEGGKQVLKPGMVEGLRLLAQAEMILEMANPSFDLLRAALLVTEAVPQLRLVMDHMPSLDPTPDTQAAYDDLIGELARQPNVSVKLSQVFHRGHDATSAPGVAAHRPRLDALIAAFGDDRVMFGSDWPNSVGTATIAQAVSLTQAYFADKPRLQAEKYFWRNAARVYKWERR
jgi:predicted TIM-barrel fold metal-dependent hydrolase